MTDSLEQGWQMADRQLHEQLHPALLNVGEKPVYSLLKRQKEPLLAEKERFLAGLDSMSPYEPDLTPDFDTEKVYELIGQVKAAREAIRGFEPVDEKSSAVRDAYHWKANSTLGDLYIALAAKEKNMRAFHMYNYFLYGSPSKELFARETDVIRSGAEALRAGKRNLAAGRVLETLGDGSSIVLTESAPDMDTFEMVKALHLGFFAAGLAGIDVPEVVIPGVGMQLVGKMLGNLGARSNGLDYKVVPASGSSASINNSLQEARYPETVTYPHDRFIGLWAGHEIGTHVRERINGQNSGFMLLEDGLDRNERGGEGKGVLREQLAYPSPEEFNRQPRAREILLRHYSAGLAVGSDGIKRKFSEVFGIITEIDEMYRINSGESDPINARRQARNYAWGLLTGRTMKGTTGSGNAYLKDMVYAEGNNAYWAFGKERPDLIAHWDIGKSDISNSRHYGVLKTLGILPGDVK